MAVEIEVNFRRPPHTHPVAGKEWCGLTGEGDAYVVEAEWAGIVGYGEGDSPSEARALASDSLRRKMAEQG